MRDIWVHIHIPKCGGSTFNAILRNNHGAGFLTTTSVLDNYQYTAKQVLYILDHHPVCTCLTGHKLSADLPYDAPEYRLRVSTFLRDPVDRFISHYFYHRHHTDWVREAKELDLDAYIDWALRDGHQKMYINGQTRFLAGTDSSEALASLASRMGREFLLLPLSRFDEALLILSKLFPESFVQIQGKTRNVSNRDQGVTDDQRTRIQSFCEADAELCRLAEAGLDELRKAAFPSEGEFSAAMDAFHHPPTPAKSPRPFVTRLRGRVSRELRRLADRIDPS